MSNKNFNYFYIEVDKCSQLAFIGHEKLVSCVEEEFRALNPGGKEYLPHCQCLFQKRE